MSDKKTPEANEPKMKKAAPPPVKKDVKVPEMKTESEKKKGKELEKAKNVKTAKAPAPVKPDNAADDKASSAEKPADGKKSDNKFAAFFISLGEKIKANKKVVFTVVPIAVAVVVIAIVAAVLLNNSKNKLPEVTLGPVYVTDQNGVAVTDENGVPVTMVVDTTYIEVTDKDGKAILGQNGKPMTSAVYKDAVYTYNVPVTDKKGNNVTDKNGANVTEKATLKQNPNNNNGGLVLGTSIGYITDGQGHTGTDPNGNPITEVIKLTSNPVAVAPADLEWKASMGGTEADYFSSIDSVKDGYIAANITNSKNGNMTEFAKTNFATPYTVLVKYNDKGDVQWRKAVGSKLGAHIVTDVITLDDGSFYTVGYAEEPFGKDGKGYDDGFVAKYDKKGNEIWAKSFGTSTVDMFNGATVTKDGGIIAVGAVGNNDGDAAGFKKPELKTAAVIVKYSADGSLVFKNVVGGNKDSFRGVVETDGGDILVLGTFASNELFKNRGKTDSGLVKFDSKGKYVSVVPIAGKGSDVFTGITKCKNGGVVVVGRSNSSDKDPNTSMFTEDMGSRGGDDAYIMKFKDDLSLVFAKPFRGQYDDELTDVIEKEDGTFVATGCSNSSTRDFKGITTRGGDDIVIASFDKFGNLSWARSFGGTANESASAICLSEKGGYVIAGRTLSQNIDMVGIAQYVNGKSVGVIAKFPE